MALRLKNQQQRLMHQIPFPNLEIEYYRTNGGVPVIVQFTSPTYRTTKLEALYDLIIREEFGNHKPGKQHDDIR